MISFDLFDNEDLKILFEGFQVSFLQGPIRRPNNSLKQYIPKGFRANKLQKNQLVKVYCDAISDREKSLTEFVTKEIESVFNDTGINDCLENNETELYVKLLDISTIILDCGLDIPAYIVLLLGGIPCSSELKESSINMYKSSAKALKTRFDAGFDKGSASSEEELLDEQKKVDRLEKAEKEYKEKNKLLNSEKKQLAETITELENSNSLLNGKLLQFGEKIDSFDLTITKAKNELLETNNALKKAQNNLREEKNNNQQLNELLEFEKAEKEKALEQAYSDDVIKRLVSDIMDEVKATSLGQKEIVGIAKKRFSESTTIIEGWEALAVESKSLVDLIVASFGEGIYDEAQLDDLELAEDNLLVQYSIIKGLKAVLFNALEKKEATSGIADSFDKEE